MCRNLVFKEWRRRHPEWEKALYQRVKHRSRERHLLRKYGLTQAMYEALLHAQGGRCAICRRTQRRAFDVDHDHQTGRIRGLLCGACNRLLGCADDDPERLERAATYLRRE